MMPQFSLAAAGFYYGWLYLRFYDTRGVLLASNHGTSNINNNKGDRSDAFAFDTFFPPALEPYIKSLARILTRLGNRIGVIPKESAESRETRKTAYTNSSSINNNTNNNNTINMENDRDYERKKAIALKALDAHLQKQ